ncbi:TolC family protein [Caulobacter segnis]
MASACRLTFRRRWSRVGPILSPPVGAPRRRPERIDVARAAFYPNINLVGLVGAQSLGISNLANAGSDLGSVGAAVNLPIFDGGRRKAGFKVARAEYDAAVAAYDGVLNQALEEVADAVVSQRALDNRLAESVGAGRGHRPGSWPGGATRPARLISPPS